MTRLEASINRSLPQAADVPAQLLQRPSVSQSQGQPTLAQPGTLNLASTSNSIAAATG